MKLKVRCLASLMAVAVTTIFTAMHLFGRKKCHIVFENRYLQTIEVSIKAGINLQVANIIVFQMQVLYVIFIEGLKSVLRVGSAHNNGRLLDLKMLNFACFSFF